MVPEIGDLGAVSRFRGEGGQFDAGFYQGVTTQYRHVAAPAGAGEILVHGDQQVYAEVHGLVAQIRHPIAESDWHFVDWLQGQGIGAELEYLQEGDRPARAVRVVVYGFFLTADIAKQFEGQALEDVLGMIADTGEINAKRRLTFSRKTATGICPGR